MSICGPPHSSARESRAPIETVLAQNTYLLTGSQGSLIVPLLRQLCKLHPKPGQGLSQYHSNKRFAPVSQGLCNASGLDLKPADDADHQASSALREIHVGGDKLS